MNEQLLQKIQNCHSLPSLPTIAVQVLDLAQKANADIGEIARIISKDPALSSKILRTVNSSFYGRSQNVSTISHALVILGLQSVKTLVLGFSLVTSLTKNKSKGFKHITYWKRSIFAATAARVISAKLGIVQQEESFLAALLMDIGMLVLDQLLGEQYGQIHAAIKSHSELATSEAAVIGATHGEVAGYLCQQWHLPPLLSAPVAHHHDPQNIKDPATRKLAELVQLAGRCADVFVDEQPAMAIADVRAQFIRDYNISAEDSDALMNEISARTKEAASLFEINIGSANEYEAILKRANEALVDITLQSQQRAVTLAEQNEQLKEQATKDGLTGLANRSAFDKFLAERFAEAKANNQSVSLLMMDLDKFKSINDKHGHPTGDAVLRATGKLLGSVARKQDLAARYGGEELVLVLPGATREVAAAVAESIRRAIAAKPVSVGNGTIAVTASIGVACFTPGGPLREPGHLVKAADLAVYNAKHSGRNCVKVFALPASPRPVAA